jgi:hypothetical protein
LKTKSLLLIVWLLAVISCNAQVQELDNCSNSELVTYEHPALLISLAIPVQWETKADKEDVGTLKLTTIDTISSIFRAFSFSQEPTDLDEYKNLRVISLTQEEFGKILDSGDLTVGENTFQFILVFEDFPDAPMTNLLVIKQDNNILFTGSCRIDGRTSDLKDFCDFWPLINSLGN